MFATTVLPSVMLRASSAFYSLFQKFLMVLGLFFFIGFVVLHRGPVGLADDIKSSLMPEAEASVPDSEPETMEAAAQASVSAAVAVSLPTISLTPKMQGALEYISRRYHVSDDALEPIFATVQSTARQLQLDPLLIVAVIGIESGFNPFSESGYGAQGLMQVVPRFHLDKLPDSADQSAFLDPVINVQVGARVLREAIRRNGGLLQGLQQFGGALDDPEHRYASKVLAERQRLERAVQHPHSV